jgi:hypothetical protein
MQVHKYVSSTTEIFQGADKRVQRYLPLFLLIICSVFVKICLIKSFWPNPDEGIFISTALRSTFNESLIASIPHAHPPLYFILLWIVNKVIITFNLETFFGSNFLPLNILVLRGISIFFCTAALVICYFLFHKMFGLLAAFFMTLFFAFSNACIEISLVIRPYALLLFLLSLDMYLFNEYLRTKKLLLLRLHSVILMLLLLTHFSSIIILVSYLFFHAFYKINKEAFIDKKTFLQIYIPPLFLAVASIVISSIIYSQNGLLKSVSEKMLARYLHPNIGQFIINCLDFISYSTPTFGSPLLQYTASIFFFGVIFTAGIFLSLMQCQKKISTRVYIITSAENLCKQKNKAFLLLCFFSLLLSIALSWIGKYPLGGSRHSAWLIPLFYVLFCASLNLIISEKRSFALTIFISVILFFLFPFKTQQEPFNKELLITTKDMNEAIFELQALTQKESIIVFDMQSLYTIYPFLIKKISAFDHNRRLIYNNAELQLLSDWNISDEKLISLADSGVTTDQNPARRKIYVFSAGWGINKILSNHVKKRVLFSRDNVMLLELML